jgi:hypothetical protein
LDSGSEVCEYKGPYISLPTQTGAIQLLMKTGDPSGQRTQELEASKKQSDCSYLVQSMIRRREERSQKWRKHHVRLHKSQCFKDLTLWYPHYLSTASSCEECSNFYLILLPQNLHTADQSQFILTDVYRKCSLTLWNTVVNICTRKFNGEKFCIMPKKAIYKFRIFLTISSDFGPWYD